MEPHDDHLTLEWLAELLLAHPELEERLLAHLGATCGACAPALQELKDLRARFKHWDACVVIAEGRTADQALARLLAEGEGDFAALTLSIEREEDFQTWGLAVVLLEKAEELLRQGNPQEARQISGLAALIAGKLGATYHPEWVSDLAAWAYAVAAAASARLGDPDGATRWSERSAAALQSGTSDPAVRDRLQDLLRTSSPTPAGT